MAKRKIFFEVWFKEKSNHHRDFDYATTLTEAKKKAKDHLKSGSSGIIIDSWSLDDEGDIDSTTVKHYSLESNGTFKQF